MTVTVYGRNSELCAQCKYTKAHLAARGISYVGFDVDTDKMANELVHRVAQDDGLSHPILPLVVITNSNDTVLDHWFGFKIDKIRGLR